MTDEDQRLVAMFESRDEQAIAEAEKTYGGFCYSIAYRILQNNQDAEECVNDAMLRIWNAIPPAEPRSLTAFVSGITRNLALDRLRRKQSLKAGGGLVHYDSLKAKVGQQSAFGGIVFTTTSDEKERRKSY